MTRRQYEDAYGPRYRKPGLLARIVVTLFKVLPKFGPFRPLGFEPLTPDAERMFLQSFEGSQSRFHQLLQALRGEQLALSDTDLDTGMKPAHGANPLADETYDELLARAAETDFANVSAELRRHHRALHRGGRECIARTTYPANGATPRRVECRSAFVVTGPSAVSYRRRSERATGRPHRAGPGSDVTPAAHSGDPSQGRDRDV